MSYDFTKLEAVLHQAGKKTTAQRQQLFGAFLESEPLSMAALIKVLQTDSTAIDRASIYRGVALFERLGIVQRLQIGWKYKLELSNAFQDHHHHVSCVICGKLVALPEDEQLESRLQVLAQREGFLASDHQIEIKGLCADCQIKSQQ
jgi:Fe2+ or Zn2+ uptake regulation protein